MKKVILLTFSLLLLILLLLPMSVSGHTALYPVSTQEINERGHREIVRVYELSEYEDSAQISRTPFERSGFRFELSEITRREMPVQRTREHTEIFTVNTQTNDLAAVMNLLPPYLEFESDDGYIGVLTLYVPSIKIESDGTRTTSHTVTRTREFPHLSNPDTALIPRTITEGGRTYELYRVDWRTQNTATVDYVQLSATFTGIATYTGTATRTHNVGFTTTAEFRGELSVITTDRTQYTVRFTGTRNNRGILTVIIMLIFLACVVVAYYVGKKGKKKLPVKAVTSVCVVLCLTLVGISQTAYASGVPSNGFGRGQTAVHINPQTTSGTINTTSVGNTANTGTLHFAHGGQAIPYNTRIGRLTVERLGRNVNIYSGATMWAMDRGAGHFSFTSLNQGNTGLVAHNRGTNGFFSFVRHLREGDILTLYANGITRRYAVVRVFNVNETDFSPLAQHGDNRLTLITCLEYQRNLRRVAVALEI